MTLGDIYTRAMWLVYGDSTPPTSTATQMQALPDGVIANLHREIQEDTSYWFMEADYGVEIPAYTRILALPSDYKEEIRPVRALAFSTDTYAEGTASCSATTSVTGSGTSWDTDWTGCKHQISWDGSTWYTILTVVSATSIVLESAGPTANSSYTIRKCTGQIELEKVKRGGSEEEAYDLGGTADYPLYYDIYDNVIHLYPMPSTDCYFLMKYFKYFPKPSTFSSHDDAVTQNAAEALIYMIAAIEERRRKEYGASEEYDRITGIKLNQLLSKHNQRTSANYVLPYIDS